MLACRQMEQDCELAETPVETVFDSCGQCFGYGLGCDGTCQHYGGSMMSGQWEGNEREKGK